MNNFTKKAKFEFDKRHKNADYLSEDFLEKQPDPFSSRKTKGLKLASSLISNVIKKSGGEKDFLKIDLQKDLEKIIGDRLSKIMYVQKASFVGQKKLKVIFKLKNPSFATFIAYEQPNIIKSIENHFCLNGKNLVSVSFKH